MQTGTQHQVKTRNRVGPSGAAMVGSNPQFQPATVGATRAGMMTVVFRILPVIGLLFAASPARSQDPIKLGGIDLNGSLRTRVEAWDWFDGAGNHQYTFPASIFKLNFSQSTPSLDWRMEFAVPFVLGLPDNAIAPGTQGQMGLGASYYAANGNRTNVALPFVKQGYLTFKSLGAEGQSLKLGRVEFIDGNEVTPANATLAAVKKDRIASRLLGNFAFSDVGRSFDGAQYSLNRSNFNVTLFGARPTRGVYQVDGWGELNINVFYGAITGQIASKTNRKHANEWRLFALGYSDYRDGVVKTDSRAPGFRKADAGYINLGTYGGHFLQEFETAAGTVEAMFWGAAQNGSWGNLKQRSYALAAEAGWQPRVLPRIKPWLRGGVDYGSGDKNPNDTTHGTFFQVLPTPRTFARFPFFNMMNLRDSFGELILRPSQRITLRGDVHSLSLATPNDLWYAGGGAFQPWTFGYTGRASNGHEGLATLYDASADFAIHHHFLLGLYYGYADGKSITESIYPNGKNSHFGYVEMTCKF